LFYHIITKPTKKSSIENAIKKTKLTITVTATDSLIIVKIKERSPEVRNIKKILKKFKKDIITVTPVRRYLKVKDVEVKEALRTNKCRFVFDVDSTLTKGNPGTIHPIIESIFQNMNDKGIFIYLATGRSMPDLVELIKKYPIEKYSIAENGGIILGFPPENYLEFGHKTEPKKVLEYLQAVHEVKEDMKQGERFTEVIFLKSDVTRQQIEEAKSETGAKIDVHESKNSYHISESDINKGSAVLELGKKIHWGNTMIIAVGDADMDIPMFENAGYSYAVGNSSEGAKKAAKKILSGKYEKGIQQIYDIIKKVA